MGIFEFRKNLRCLASRSNQEFLNPMQKFLLLEVGTCKKHFQLTSCYWNYSERGRTGRAKNNAIVQNPIAEQQRRIPLGTPMRLTALMIKLYRQRTQTFQLFYMDALLKYGQASSKGPKTVTSRFNSNQGRIIFVSGHLPSL